MTLPFIKLTLKLVSTTSTRDQGLGGTPLTCDRHRRYRDTALRAGLFLTSSSSLQGTLARKSCTWLGVMLAKSRNFSGSTELLKAHTKHFPSRRASRIQTRGAARARCSTEEHMYLEGKKGGLSGRPAGRDNQRGLDLQCSHFLAVRELG